MSDHHHRHHNNHHHHHHQYHHHHHHIHHHYHYNYLSSCLFPLFITCLHSSETCYSSDGKIRVLGHIQVKFTNKFMMMERHLIVIVQMQTSCIFLDSFNRKEVTCNSSYLLWPFNLAETVYFEKKKVTL